MYCPQRRGSVTRSLARILLMNACSHSLNIRAVLHAFWSGRFVVRCLTSDTHPDPFR